MKELIKIDGPGFRCCKRYYYYGLHSLKCQLENSLHEDEDIHYAELPKEKLTK